MSSLPLNPFKINTLFRSKIKTRNLKTKRTKKQLTSHNQNKIEKRNINQMFKDDN